MEIHDHTFTYKHTAANLWAYQYIRDRDLNFDWHNAKIIDEASPDYNRSQKI